MRLLALCAVLALAPAGKTTLVVGQGLNEPFGIDFDADGAAYIVEMGGHKVSVLSKDGKLTTLAGTGEKGFAGDGGPGAKAQFNGPHHLLFGPDGGLYVADTWNWCVRRIDVKTGIVTTVAGTGKKGNAPDGGAAAKSDLGGIYCIAFGKGVLYACDLDNRRVRAVDLRTGVITTAAGNGQKGVPKDGERAVDQPLVDPRAVTVDSKGNLYVLERGGHALRVVDPSGRIRTVAGTGKAGLSGDGGPALQAQMNGPKHISAAPDDTILIADAESNTVRVYSPKDVTIRRVIGTGKKGADGIGGPPEQCQVARPHGVIKRPSGETYVCDTYNHRVIRIDD